jgi:4-amino-4-deoxychorismate lyase
MNQAMAELFPEADRIDLKKEISVPDECKQGTFKIRVLYGEIIERIETDLYIPRIILSLKVVEHESVDYHLKFTDRQILQELFALRGTCDDIIIIKNGCVTDSFAANLLFFDGVNWFTPSTPLLKGTKRQFLIDHGIISEREIRKEDILGYQQVGLINAMTDFEEMPVIALPEIF